MKTKRIYKGGNYNFGEYQFSFKKNKNCLLETQKVVIESFFQFCDGFIIPYGVELCFKYFDCTIENQMSALGYQPYILKRNKPKLSFLPIFSKTIEISIQQMTQETVLTNLTQIESENEHAETIKGLAHLSFQAGAFRLPNKSSEKKFLLEGANSVNEYVEWDCISDEWFEAPLKEKCLYPPLEINFSYEPSFKLWHLKINLNWDIYSENNEVGFLMFFDKINILKKIGWIME